MKMILQLHLASSQNDTVSKWCSEKIGIRMAPIRHRHSTCVLLIQPVMAVQEAVKFLDPNHSGLSEWSYREIMSCNVTEIFPWIRWWHQGFFRVWKSKAYLLLLLSECAQKFLECKWNKYISKNYMLKENKISEEDTCSKRIWELSGKWKPTKHTGDS